MKYFLFLALASVFVGSCSPKASLSKFPNANFDPWDDELGFAVLSKKDTVEESAVKVGLIKVGDGGMTIGCDYASMMNLITDEAKANGANLVKVLEHKVPDHWSTCHRIKAFAYRVEDIAKYEDWIKWSANRQLEVRNFKSSSDNRPMDYRTASRIMYSWQQIKGKKVELETWAEFSCLQSYITEPIAEDSLGLAIQQLIFDNTEVHSRMILKEIDEAGFQDFYMISEQLSPIADRIVKALDERADLMIVDISKDRENYAKWRKKIDEELNNLTTYDGKAMKFNF